MSKRSWPRTALWMRSLGRAALVIPFSLACPTLLLGADKADNPSGLPNIYLDLRTNYASVPAGSFAIGLGETSLFETLSRIATIANLANLPSPPGRPALSSPAIRGVGVDVPLTVDVTDAVSLYGGFTASTTQNDLSGWSNFAVTSWLAGVHADLYQQNGGRIPTMTLQATVTRSVPDAPLATTSVNAVFESSYAFDQDETRGVLAGVQYTGVEVDSPMAHVGGTVAGYVGGYYQWENNWKVTGRFGVQSFAGAQLANLASFDGFTQPIVRLDLDRMDDNDNRLFGVTAEIAWTPKPTYQLTVRTPLYAVRH